MLALTKKTGYGLIALTHLARQEDEGLCSAREIAEEYGVPLSLLMNVLKELAAKGLVESVRGARGGYRLSCDPREVTLAQLVETLEGPIRLAECVTGEVNQESAICRVMQKCPIADPVHRVQRKICDFLSGVSLAEIACPTAAEAPAAAEV